MAKKNSDSTKPIPTSSHTIDWGEIFKHQVPITLDDLEAVLPQIVEMKRDKLDSVNHMFECSFSATAANFLIELANLPENPKILFARNDIGILAYSIRQHRPQARFTFYSDDIDIHAYHSYIFPDERAPSPRVLLDLAAEEDEQFDLVIGGIRRKEHLDFTRELSGVGYISSNCGPPDYDGQKFMIALSKLLKDGGRLISDMWESHGNGYMKDREAERRWLRECCKLTGLSVNAVIENVPSSALSFGDDAVVVINSTAPQSKVFSARYSDDERIRDTIVSSFLTQLPAKRVHAGYWGSLRSFESNSRQRHLEMVHERASMAGLLPVKLGEILGGSADRENVISVKPVLLSSGNDEPRVLVSQGELPGLRVCIDREKALAEYIVGFLNESQLGAMILPDLIAEVGDDNQLVVSEESVRNFTVYLPDLKTQAEVVRNRNILASLRSDIDENLLRLWRKPEEFDDVRKNIKMINTEDTFSSWIDQLPFPLASILWSYKAQCRTDKEKYEKLLHFFEALAEFLCTVHLSALSSKTSLWHQIKPLIKKQEDFLPMSRPTFGTWITLLEIMAGFTRNGIGKDTLKPEILDAYKVSQTAPIEQLSSASIIKVLRFVVPVRNDWPGHGGAIGDNRAREILGKLEYSLQELRKPITGIWEYYDLVLAGSGRYSGAEYRYEVQRIMGSRTPFERCEIGTVHVLVDKRLYLFGLQTSKAIKMLPFLQVVPSPSTDVDACYFYNKKHGAGETRFVSYHFDRDAEFYSKISADFSAALRLFEE